MLRKLNFVPTLLGLIAIFLLPAVATADIPTFAINDLTDTVTVTTDSANQSRLFTDCVAEGCFFSILGPTNAVTYRASFAGIVLVSDQIAVNMFEPGGGVSDTLQQTDDNNAKTFWQFNSDTEAPLEPFQTTNNLIENGTAQPAIHLDYLDANGALVGSALITIQSDVETPEPSFRIMALAGLLAMVGVTVLRRLRTA